MNMLKSILAGLLIILGCLSLRFWCGADNVVTVVRLQQQINIQELELQTLSNRNAQVIRKINKLKKYPDAIEEQARYELGMVKNGEKYYQVVEPVE